MKLTSTADIGSRFFNILVHGKPGSGKTMSCATAPRPVLLLTEPGGEDCLSAANIEKVFGIATPGVSYEIPVLKALTWEELLEAVTFLEKDPSMQHFDTVFADSISQISKLALAKFQGTNKDGRKAYGELYKAVMWIVGRLFALKKHVVCNAHSAEQGIGEARAVVPTFEGGALKVELAHAFGETYYADVDYADDGTPIRVLRTQKGAGFEAKSRLGHLPEMVQPNWTKIFATLNEGISKGVTKPAEAAKAAK